MSTDDRKWEIIESEYLIRRPWLTARRDRVKLPTGVEIPEYYILEYPDWVNVIAITKEGKFVLVRRVWQWKLDKTYDYFSKCQHHDKYHSLLSGYGGRTNLYPAFGRN